MKKFLNSDWLWVILTALAIVFLACHWLDTRAQKVERKGNMFIQIGESTIKKDSATATGYFYLAKDGVKYPIYMSSKGKCFIIKISKKTGKQYRQYLPQITEQLAYENSKRR